MKKRAIGMTAEHIGTPFLALLAIIAALAGGCASSTVADPGDVATIEALLRAQTDAWNRGDLHAFVAGYDESPQRMTFVGSKGVLVRGRAALEERYLASYPAGRQGTLRFSDLEIRRLGPDAYLVLGAWALARPPDDPHGRFTLVFARGPEGLRIVHDHSSGAE